MILRHDLSRLFLAPQAKATSPRRRTPPLRQTSSATFAYAADAPLLSLRDIFPVSSGTFTRFIGRAYPEGDGRFLFQDSFFDENFSTKKNTKETSFPKKINF